MKNKKYKVVLVNGSMGESDILEVREFEGSSKKRVSYRVFEDRILEVVKEYLEEYENEYEGMKFNKFMKNVFEFEGVFEFEDNKICVSCGEENYYIVIEEGEEIYNKIDELSGVDISESVWNEWMKYLDRKELV